MLSGEIDGSVTVPSLGFICQCSNSLPGLTFIFTTAEKRLDQLGLLLDLVAELNREVDPGR